jgi:hypothetical protein
MQPTPLRAEKIAAILALRCARTSFRSIGAARLMGNPLGRLSTSPIYSRFFTQVTVLITLPRKTTL